MLVNSKKENSECKCMSLNKQHMSMKRYLSVHVTVHLGCGWVPSEKVSVTLRQIIYKGIIINYASSSLSL